MGAERALWGIERRSRNSGIWREALSGVNMMERQVESRDGTDFVTLFREVGGQGQRH